MRGVGGLALALPFLESAAPRQAAASSFPKRLVVFFTSNGTVLDNWTPKGTENNFTFGPILQPLNAHKKDLIVIGGVDAESSYHGPGDAGHSSGMGHMLTGTELIDLGDGELTGGGISVDQKIANSVGTDTELPSLELCVENHDGDVRTRMCYAAAQQPVPPECDPQKVYTRLFAPLAPDIVGKRRSVLDAVSEDLTALKARVGTDDRVKLEAHLTAVRTLEQRLSFAPTGSCQATPPSPVYETTDFVDIGRQHMDMLTLALSCDLTRVVTLQWSQARSLTQFKWLGISQLHHDLSHMSLDDTTVVDKLTRINQWYATQLAYLLDNLKSIPEGDGTMLDHTVVLWANCMAVGEVHLRRGIPYVLAGNCGGFFKTGRYLQFNGKATHNQLLTSLCQAMGLDVQKFGNPAYCAGPLPGLRG